MQYYTLDSVVRGILLKEGKSDHYYLQLLSAACDGLQKLHIHTLKHVNSKKLPVNEYKAVHLPCDYVDFVRVGFPVGERVRPMIQDDTLNRQYNVEDGIKVPFPLLPDGQQDLSYAYDLPETPRFNLRHYWQDYVYRVLTERGEIQLSADYPHEFIVLDYITDGLEADAATKVDPLAKKCLERFIEWEYKVHSRSYSDSERREAERRFHDEHRLLRAAKNPLTKADIVAAVRSGYSGTY